MRRRPLCWLARALAALSVVLCLAMRRVQPRVGDAVGLRLSDNAIARLAAR